MSYLTITALQKGLESNSSLSRAVFTRKSLDFSDKNESDDVEKAKIGDLYFA